MKKFVRQCWFVAMGMFLMAGTIGVVQAYALPDPWEDWGIMEPEYEIIQFPIETTTSACVLGGSTKPLVGRIIACAQPGPRVHCRIFITHPRDLPPGFYEKVLRHEKAHCRGWRHGEPKPEGEL